MLKMIAGALALAATAAPAFAAELVANGSFEASGGSLFGWTSSSNITANTGASYAGCCGSFGSQPAFSTNHFAAFGGANLAGTFDLAQTLATVAGASYSISFDSGTIGSSGSQIIKVLVGNDAAVNFLGNATQNFDAIFSHHSFNFVAASNSTLLTFRVIAPADDNVDTLLDNVSAIGPAQQLAVPEPASWAMLLGGFGMVGGVLRRRRRIALSFG